MIYDLIIAGAAAINAAAVTPMIWHRVQVPMWTALPTAVSLTAMVAAFVGLGLVYSAVVTAFTAGGWWALAARR